MEKATFKKYAGYTFLVLAASNVVIDIAKPNLLPLDNPNTAIVVHSTSGSLGSVLSSSNITVSFPAVQQLDANKHVDKYGKSYYVARFNKDNII